MTISLIVVRGRFGKSCRPSRPEPVTAVVGGLGAAIIWSIGSIGSSRAARELGPMLTLAWVMVVGLGLVALMLPFSGSASLSPSAFGWLVLSGAGNVGGLLLFYRAVRLGQLGVVMPIAAADGSIAALIAILAGQSVGGVRGAALGATVLGVLLTASSSRRGLALPAATSPPLTGGPRAVATPTGYGDRRAAAWISFGALSFGIGLYATARAGAALPVTWAVMPPRVVGVLSITIPLAICGRLEKPDGCGRWLLLAGVCEVAGFVAYTTGARHGIAVAAVLSTLAGAFGAVIGRLLYGERLRVRQILGVALIFGGVATLSALTS